MLVVFFRTLILYCVIVFGVRLMGKRQLGELQPSELVVTILISNIATLPIEEIDTPLMVGLLPILSLVVFEIIISIINLHFREVRRVFSGTPVVVIHHGVVDQKKLRQLRYSADDLMAQLRSQNIYSLSEVDFALVETTGKLSVYQKYLSRPATGEALSLQDQPSQNSPPLVLVSEGRVNEAYLELCCKDRKWLEQTIASHHLTLNQVFLLTLDQKGTVELIPREVKK